MVNKEIIEGDKTFITNFGDNTVCLPFKNGVDFELEDAVKADQIICKMAQGKPFLSFMEGRFFLGISPEARNFSTKDNLVKEI